MKANVPQVAEPRDAAKALLPESQLSTRANTRVTTFPREYALTGSVHFNSLPCGRIPGTGAAISDTPIVLQGLRCSRPSATSKNMALC